MLSIKVKEELEILVGSNKRGDRKLDESVSTKLLRGSDVSYCSKSMLKSPRKIFFLELSLLSFPNNDSIILFVKLHNAKADTFVHSFSRFIARRVCSSLDILGNGTIFTANETQSFIGVRNIIWKFNIDAAPWWVGIWERLVAFEAIETLCKKKLLVCRDHRL